ncbi:MAG: inositol monophosphatase family protein [Acidobacteriota bacterium]
MKRTELDEALALAEEVAREAGQILLERQVSGFKVAKKGRVNLVTEADLASESLIVSRIREAFPAHQILAEEGGTTGGDAGVKWIIDPLDGTTNYAHGYPAYCVSIGLEVEGCLVGGIVYDPVREECFSGRLGEGAFMNGETIHVSQEEKLEDSLLCTGFSYEAEEIVQNLRHFNYMMRHARSVRRDGSAALDLCYVACGRFDGFWELSLQPWDVAAGTIIVREAGGRMTRFDGSTASIYDRECLATNERLHEIVSRILMRQERASDNPDRIRS